MKLTNQQITAYERDGFLVLEDAPKTDITQTVQQLRSLGVGLKMITGDNRLVAGNVARQVGLSADRILTHSGLARSGSHEMASGPMMESSAPLPKVVA
jgi:Mg2+-importing ATPase